MPGLLPLSALTAWLLMTSSAETAERRASAKDPCTELQSRMRKYSVLDNQYLFARPSEVLPCTQSMAFTKMRDLGNLNSIINYFKSFYGLLHVAKRSPDPRLPSNYDVISKLQSVGKRKWVHAEEFYNAIGRAIDGLQDGHTGIRPNCPPFVHRLALPFVGVVERGQHVVRAAPTTLLDPVFVDMAKAAPYKFDPNKYAGARVTKIKNQTAWTYMRKWAAKNAYAYHSLGQQLNDAFAHLDWKNGTRTVSYGSFATRLYNPKHDFLEVALIRSGQTKAQVVKIPFMSYTSNLLTEYFTTTGIYFDFICSTSPLFSNRLPSPKDPLLRQGHIRTVPSQFLAHTPALLVLKQGRDVTPDGLYWKVYKLNDGQTSVVTLSTFYPELFASTFDLFTLFANNTRKAFAVANRLGSRILIDVSSNGGGIVALYPLVVELLLGSTKFNSLGSSALNSWNMLADTDVVKLLRANDDGDFAYYDYNDLSGVPFSSDTKSKFFYPIKNLTFGPKGVFGEYSSNFKGTLLTLGFFSIQPVSPAFGSKPWALFSDGQCFSTCSEFATVLNLRFGVPVVGIGGIKGEPLVYSAAGGGFVTGDAEDNFQWYFPPEVKALKDAPTEFTLRMRLAMRFANGFLSTGTKGGVNMSAPIEFQYAAAKKTIDFTLANIADPTQQYQEAADAVFK